MPLDACLSCLIQRTLNPESSGDKRIDRISQFLFVGWRHVGGHKLANKSGNLARRWMVARRKRVLGDVLR